MKRIILALFAILLTTETAAFAAKKVKWHRVDGVPGEYMVVLDDSVPGKEVKKVADELRKAYGVQPLTLWEFALSGFLCRATEEAIERLTTDPRVKFVEQNFLTQAPQPGTSSTQWTTWNGEYLWHLDRVDELAFTEPYRDSQLNMCTEGRSVYAYVIDTGVQVNHVQFESPSRVVLALDFSDNRANPSSTTYGTDTTNGCTAGQYANLNSWHGTAVASVLAGTQVGVAKPQIVSLKVATCSGAIRTDDLIDAVNWIGSPANPYRYNPGVVNHSGFVPMWSNDPPTEEDDFSAYSEAVGNLVRIWNKPFFTSADNFSTDSCRFSPNNLARTMYRTLSDVYPVISVGGTSSDDARYQFPNDYGQDSGSNSGACVSVYAPAEYIYAARTYTTTPAAYGYASGTSFASPLVAGIAARYMEREYNRTGSYPSYFSVYDWIINQASYAPVSNTQTVGYYYCLDRVPGDGVWDRTWTSSPPATCPSGSWGYDAPTNSWGAGFPPYYFPPVGNDSGARVIYFDEGYCPAP